MYNGKLRIDEARAMGLTDPRPKHCDYCGARFRERVPGQRFCRRWCRLQWRAAEGRSQRRVWIGAGRPVFSDRPVLDEPREQAIDRRF